MPPKRFSFKSDVKYDIALLTEVEVLNPFVSKNQKPKWEEIAKNLIGCDHKMPVTARSCRERTMLILQDFKTDEALSQRSSGVDEEDMDRLKQLLTSVGQLADAPVSRPAQKLYNKKSRTEAEKERERAIQSVQLSDSDISDEGDEIKSDEAITTPSSSSTTNTPAPVKEDVVSPNVKSKRVRKGDVVDYLEKKHKSELDLRREELGLKKFEAETRRMEVEMLREKNALEQQTKMEELELRRASEKMQNDERQAMTQALLSMLKK